MDNYTKVVLYAYPLLQTVGQDYAEHIKNKAILSYKSMAPAEETVTYLAEEIIRKEKLEWLKNTVESVLDKLTDVERTLVAIRYFGKPQKARLFVRVKSKSQDTESLTRQGMWSERGYFRKQQRLSEKVGAMLKTAGLSEEVYQRDFAAMEMFSKIHRFINEGKDRKISADERRWMRLEGERR